MKVKAFLAALSTAAILVPFSQAHSASVANGTYHLPYLPPNAVYEVCANEPFPPAVGPANPTGEHIGAVCLEINSSKKVRVVEIADALSETTGLSWYWLDENWNEVGEQGPLDDPVAWLPIVGFDADNSGSGCESTPYLPAPEGAKYFYVFVESGAFTAVSECSPGAYATTGEVVVQVASK